MHMTPNNTKHSDSHTWNEILSQGKVWQSVIDETCGSEVVEKTLTAGRAKRKWVFVGCGTSFYLAEAAASSWTLLSAHPARAGPASEIRLYPQLLRAEGPEVQAVVISRSGSTSEAVRAANA